MRPESIKLREIIDSRTNPTVEAEINGSIGRAPSGASAGSHEAACHVPEDLDGIEEELQELEGEDLSQEEFDSRLKEIDGSDGMDRIGAVGIAASFAFKQASGFDRKNLFPLPLSNVVGGGEHGGNTSIQEFLVLPVEADSFPEAVRINAEIYQDLKDRYSRKVLGMNDEGALIAQMDDEETLRAVKKVADDHGARLGLDVAANELYENGKYKLSSMQDPLEPKEMLKFVQKLIDQFNLLYVEDPFHEDDFEMHGKLSKKNPELLITGDDLFVTQEDRLQQGVDLDSCNSLIVKPNQAGTVTAARETVDLAHEEDYTPVVSHRSGETCDPTISDLSLEWQAPVIKAGIADIRIAKLNRLIRLWDSAENPEMNSIR